MSPNNVYLYLLKIILSASPEKYSLCFDHSYSLVLPSGHLNLTKRIMSDHHKLNALMNNADLLQAHLADALKHMLANAESVLLPPNGHYENKHPLLQCWLSPNHNNYFDLALRYHHSERNLFPFRLEQTQHQDGYLPSFLLHNKMIPAPEGIL